jgi:hypothetical protein
MPIVIAALLGGLAQAASSLVGRVLIALGIGFVAYEGADTLIQAMVAYAQVAWSSLPSGAFEVVNALRVPQAISILASGYAAQIAVRTSTGVITRMVSKS